MNDVIAGSQAAPSPELIHQEITEKFTNRYLAKMGPLQRLAYSMDYDPGSPYCDYTKTWFEARPNESAGILMANSIFGALHGLGVTGRKIHQAITDPLLPHVPHLVRLLKERPLVVVQDHMPDLQAGLSAYALGRALSDRDPEPAAGDRGSSFSDMARLTHLTATRAFTPIMVGRPGAKLHVPLVQLAQTVMNAHFNIPNNDQVRNSPVLSALRKDYNARFKQNLLEAVGRFPLHPLGYHELVSMSPGNTRDLKGKDHQGNTINVIAAVKPGTVELIRSLGATVLPFFTNFKKGRLYARIGEPIPADKFDEETMHRTMSQQARIRTAKSGEPTYYALDKQVAEIIRPA